MKTYLPTHLIFKAILILAVLSAVGQKQASSASIVFSSLPPKSVLGAVKDPVPTTRVEIKSSLSTAEDAIAEMYVTHPFEYVPSAGSMKVISDIDAVELQRKYLEDFVRGTGEFSKLGTPDSEKEIVLSIYRIGEPGFSELLIEAKKRKFKRVVLITDLNETFDGSFEEGEKFNSRFSKAKYKDTAVAENIKKLALGGFKFNGDQFAIYSQPLYNDELVPMQDIMHRKSLYFISGSESNRKVFEMKGTANPTNGRRYNRVLKMRDPLIIEEGIAHAETVINTFKKFGRIKDIPERTPLKVIYKDGTSITQYFTDGNINPNLLWRDLFNQAAIDPEVKLNKFLGSHFVWSNTQVYDALNLALEAQPEFKARVFLGSKFTTTFNYGVGGALSGFTVHRPLGPSIYPVSKKVRKQVDVQVYMKASDGVVTASNPLGDRIEWHDKTSYLEYEYKGKKQVRISTGSLNLSNHFTNEEEQMIIDTHADSNLAKAFAVSIEGAAEIERINGFMVTGEVAIIRGLISDMTGIPGVKVSNKAAAFFLQKIYSEDLEGAFQSLAALISGEGDQARNLKPNDLLERLKIIQSVLSDALKVGGDDAYISAQKVAAVVFVVEHPEGRIDQLYQSIKSLLYGAPITEAKMGKAIDDVAKKLNLAAEVRKKMIDFHERPMPVEDPDAKAPLSPVVFNPNCDLIFKRPVQ